MRLTPEKLFEFISRFFHELIKMKERSLGMVVVLLFESDRTVLYLGSS